MGQYIESVLMRWLKKDMSVAVVCSGKGNEKYGERIDRYDVVIRFNDSPTDNYEKIVGTKTSVRCVRNNEWANVIKNKKEYASDMVFILSQKSLKRGLAKNEFMCKIPHRRVTGMLLSSGIPSTGFIMLSLLWSIGIRATVYNCDFGKSGYYYPITKEGTEMLVRGRGRFEKILEGKINDIHNIDFYNNKETTKHDFREEEKLMNELRWHTFRR